LEMAEIDIGIQTLAFHQMKYFSHSFLTVHHSKILK